MVSLPFPEIEVKIKGYIFKITPLSVRDIENLINLKDDPKKQMKYVVNAGTISPVLDYERLPFDVYDTLALEILKVSNLTRESRDKLWKKNLNPSKRRQT